MTGGVIRPGEPWFDTDGHRIQAHGGSVLAQDGFFYWYGENKEHTAPGSGIWHWGIRCYRSTDLCTWEDLGLIIPPVEDDPDSPLHPAQMVDRPHIVRDPRTGRYVAWLKIMHRDGRQLSTVLVADALCGPYEIVATDVRPNGMYAGDFDLVVDPVDGKGYHYYGRPHSELVCADLSDDFTATTGYYSTHFPGKQPPEAREAPAYFRRGRTHYLVTSGTSGYFPNRSQIASADTYHGPWTVLGDPHPGDPTGTSFRSQVTSVFRHPGKRDLYIALADRWLPHRCAEQSDQTDVFRRLVAGEPLDDVVTAELRQDFFTADTRVADYVWLPIRFDGSIPTIEWRDEWRIDEFD
ncbi:MULTISPECIES: family 43 glycosylhydrolase [unclassified Streptomyces]|uniref:family 43 glycosylhydrolase n=1 Tax=unclassified Streptomyces TaxID=2593676 RepID=UPI0036E31F87